MLGNADTGLEPKLLGNAEAEDPNAGAEDVPNAETVDENAEGAVEAEPKAPKAELVEGKAEEALVPKAEGNAEALPLPKAPPDPKAEVEPKVAVDVKAPELGAPKADEPNAPVGFVEEPNAEEGAEEVPKADTAVAEEGKADAFPPKADDPKTDCGALLAPKIDVPVVVEPNSDFAGLTPNGPEVAAVDVVLTPKAPSEFEEGVLPKDKLPNPPPSEEDPKTVVALLVDVAGVTPNAEAGVVVEAPKIDTGAVEEPNALAEPNIPEEGKALENVEVVLVVVEKLPNAEVGAVLLPKTEAVDALPKAEVVLPNNEDAVVLVVLLPNKEEVVVVVVVTVAAGVAVVVVLIVDIKAGVSRGVYGGGASESACLASTRLNLLGSTVLAS